MKYFKTGKVFTLLFLLMTFIYSSVSASEKDICITTKQDSSTTFIVSAFDPVSKGNVGELTCKVWSAIGSQDDIKTYNLIYGGGNYSYQVNMADHGNDSGIYYIEIYGSSGLLSSSYLVIQCDANEWVRYFYDNGNVVPKVCRAVLKIKPLIEKSTQEANSGEKFKSGYGYMLTLNTDVESNTEVEAGKALAGGQNALVVFPEFNYFQGVTLNDQYGQYNRLSQCTEISNTSNIAKAKLEFKENPFSAKKIRVHFTPLWYLDDLNYTPYAEVFDAWTPAGMLSKASGDTFAVQGTVYDDWQLNEKR